MSKIIEVEIEVGSKQALKSLQDLETAQEQLLQQLKQTEIGTAEYARLQKQLKAVGNQVKDLELGFEALDKEQRGTAIVDSFTGIAGAITAATGAFTLFGAESEDLAVVEKRILGLIALTTGLRDINNGLVAANKLLGSSFTDLGNSIKTAFSSGTVAANLFKGALASIGIGIVIAGVVALVDNFEYLKNTLLGVADATALTSDELDTASKEAGKNIAQVEILTAKVQDQTLAEEDRRKALKELEEKYPNYFKNLGDDINNTDALKKSKDKLIDSLVRESKVRALGSRIEAEATKFAEQRLEALQDVRDQEAAQLDRQQKLAKARAGEFIAYGLTQEQTIAGLQKDLAAGQTFIANARARSQERITKINKDEEEAISALTQAINIETKAIEANGGATEVKTEKTEKSTKATKKETEAEKEAAKTKAELAKKQDEAAKIAAEAADEVAEITLSARQKEIEDIEDAYKERLALLTEIYGIESEEVKNLTILKNKEISDINFKYDQEEIAKTKEKEQKKADLIDEISSATAVTEEEKRKKELDDIAKYYDDLIAEAEKYGIDITALAEAKNKALKEKNDEYKTTLAEDVEEFQSQVNGFANIAKDFVNTIGDFYKANSEAQTNYLKSQLDQGLLTQEEYDAKLDQLNKETFEKQKNVSIASAIISTLQGALDAFTSTLKIDPTGITGGILASLALAAGFAQVEAIKSTNYDSTNTSAAAPKGGGGIPSTKTLTGRGTNTGPAVPISLTPTTGGGTIGPEGEMQTGQTGGGGSVFKTYVLSGDVTSAQDADFRLRTQRKF